MVQTRLCRAARLILPPLVVFLGMTVGACAGASERDEPAGHETDTAGAAAPAPSPGPAPTSPPGPAPADTSGRSAEEPDSATTAAWTARDTRVTNTVTGVAVLTAVRTAAHPDFDRIVFEFAGAEVPSYKLEYIDRPVRQCGSGDTVPLAGDAWLSMQFEPANAHTEQGQPTVTERSRAPRLPNVLELKLICDFEAVVEWVAGVRSPEPYRITVLKSPTRLVIDIRHAR